MAQQPSEPWLDPKAEAALREIHGATAINALAENLSEDIYEVLAILLAQNVFGARSGIGSAFLQADLKRRNAEAAMVQSEAEMFRTISATLKASSSAPETFAMTAQSASELVSALAEKNATMGEGDPAGGTSVPRPPEEPAAPEPTPGGGTEPPEGCYDRYRRELSDLWRHKDNMDAYDWWLQWADLLNKLVLCAGPSAAKALIDIIKAGGK
ncbi:hypothetical protein [Hoeflea sp.]|uniref:hypothetical protein n=1 Tax=Hoeflea sp. TaxID=1940281 RepID=UPI003B52850C